MVWNTRLLREREREIERDSMGISVSLELESLLCWAMRGMVVEGVGLGIIFCVRHVLYFYVNQKNIDI